jgi:predicted translin family RNA/ssDNA-binding protein
MRILVLRKQELGPDEVPAGLTPETAQTVQAELNEKQNVLNEISEHIQTINQKIIDNYKALNVNTLEQVRNKLAEAVSVLEGGAAGARFFFKSDEEASVKVDPVLDPIASDICTSAGELVFHLHDGRTEEALAEIRKIGDDLEHLEMEITNRCSGVVAGAHGQVRSEISAEEIRGKTPMWLASEVGSQVWKLRYLLPEQGQKLGRKKCFRILSKIETIKTLLNELELRLTVGPTMEAIGRKEEGM